MRRVVIVGTSGSGKTTVAKALAERLALPLVELDALNHGPGWTEATPAELRERVLAATASGGWVVDGSYEGKLGDLVLERADTLVWLDVPLRVALSRLWRRTSQRTRDDVVLWNRNRESWRKVLLGWDSLFVWAVRSHVRRRRKLPRRLQRHRHLRVVRLRSSAEVELWLEGR